MTTSVLIIDDSAVVRQVLTKLLDGKGGIEVIGAAQDPLFAMKRMQAQWPDVIVLDIEMPRMDGLTFLRKLMADRPTPVVVCSTLTGKGTEIAMQALAAGAVEIITKPRIALKDFLVDSDSLIVDAVKAAAVARVGRPTPAGSSISIAEGSPQPKVVRSGLHSGFVGETTDYVVAIGTSTGGTKALESILPRLQADSPGVVVVQHMPEQFTAAFANRLDGLCEVEVLEARPEDRIIPGRVLIAPGGRHMLVRRSGAQYRVEVKDGPLVSRHKPSVDVLFRSVARSAAENAVGIILTGMGDDGAAGMLEMHKSGALTIAEDASTCVVHGMPREAVKRGGVDRELPLHEIPPLIRQLRDRAGLRRACRQKGLG